jgi:hypothetical protein
MGAIIHFTSTYKYTKIFLFFQIIKKNIMLFVVFLYKSIK